MPKTVPQPSATQQFTLSPDYIFTGVSAWLVPGAGHWLLGYRVRGAVLLVSVVGLFWVGQALAQPTDVPWNPLAVSRKVSPVFFACQVGNGFCALLSDSMWGKPRYEESNTRVLNDNLPRHLNLAILLTSVSGLLNFLIVLHIFDPRTWAQAAIDRAAANPFGAGNAAGGTTGPKQGAP
jgi:hypothetical protein